MKTLILIAALLAATPDAGVDAGKPDAGAPDAGSPKVEEVLKTESVKDQRRFQLLLLADKLVDAMSKDGPKVKLGEILFATTSYPTKDAAVITFKTIPEGDTKAIFMLWTIGDDKIGRWQVFPTDFTSKP